MKVALSGRHRDTQHNDTPNNGLKCDTQHNDDGQHRVPFTLRVVFYCCAEYRYAECRYAVRHCAECRGANRQAFRFFVFATCPIREIINISLP
jgi:hypothetical protein